MKHWLHSTVIGAAKRCWSKSRIVYGIALLIPVAVLSAFQMPQNPPQQNAGVPGGSSYINTSSASAPGTTGRRLTTRKDQIPKVSPSYEVKNGLVIEIEKDDP